MKHKSQVADPVKWLPKSRRRNTTVYFQHIPVGLTYLNKYKYKSNPAHPHLFFEIRSIYEREENYEEIKESAIFDYYLPTTLMDQSYKISREKYMF